MLIKKVRVGNEYAIEEDYYLKCLTSKDATSAINRVFPTLETYKSGEKVHIENNCFSNNVVYFR